MMANWSCHLPWMACHVAYIKMECKKLMVFGMPFSWFAILDEWQMA
jgi:hypothetical protein